MRWPHRLARLVLILLLLAAPCQAAIATVASGTADLPQTDFFTTCSFTGTITLGGPNGAVFVFLQYSTGGGSINTVKLDASTGLTKINTLTTDRIFEAWYAPTGSTSGTHTIDIVAGASIDHIWGVASAYSGVKQTGIPDASNLTTISSGTVTMTLTTVADNSWLLAWVSDRGNSTDMAAGASTVVRKANSSYARFVLYDSNGARTPAGSQSLNATDSYTGAHDVFEISIAPDTGGAAAVVRGPLLGVLP